MIVRGLAGCAHCRARVPYTFRAASGEVVADAVARQLELIGWRTLVVELDGEQLAGVFCPDCSRMASSD